VLKQNGYSKQGARRGFILFFGVRPIVTDDPGARSVSAVCPRCGQRAEFSGKIVRPWFTLFLLPLFPVGRSHAVSQCSNCGQQFPVETRALGLQVAKADQQQQQLAISLYNSLRHSPANAITLNELMTLYATIGEYDQAISAARDYPAALQSSEQCMVTLGRVHLAKAEPAVAVRYFDQALERNDTLADAHYYKAVAYATSNPPNDDKAIASARQARKAGHPSAEQLLNELERRSQNPSPQQAR
jgi:tetratricopeptide (TPR) repeat protein